MRNALPFNRIPFNRLPGSLRLWLMLAAGCLLAYSFFEIVEDVFFDPLEGDLEAREFDAAAAQFLTQFRSEKLTQVAIDLTALGSVSVLAAFSILAYAAVIGTRAVTSRMNDESVNGSLIVAGPCPACSRIADT